MSQKILAQTLPIKLSDIARASVFAIISVLSFSIPFFLGHPQWLVGTIVNACLFLGAIFLPGKLYLPLIVLPSLGVLARGMIFGPFTPFLAYFLPFIWLGNLILILSFKKLSKYNYLFSVVAASLLKFLFLFAVANIYFNFSIVPAIFLKAMGIFQILTAMAGGIISLILFQAWKTKALK